MKPDKNKKYMIKMYNKSFNKNVDVSSKITYREIKGLIKKELAYFSVYSLEEMKLESELFIKKDNNVLKVFFVISSFYTGFFASFLYKHPLITYFFFMNILFASEHLILVENRYKAYLKMKSECVNELIEEKRKR